LRISAGCDAFPVGVFEQGEPQPVKEAAMARGLLLWLLGVPLSLIVVLYLVGFLH
jgi:hypothetical protein